MPYHLIFEGAELAGKSWIISQIYNHIEPKYNASGNILNGCHWFNCDVGIYGTEHGKRVNKNYLKICEELKGSNIILEKFHISDIVYNKIFHKKNISYKKIEEVLAELGFKVILITLPPDPAVIEKRLQDRLNLYPHYARIAQNPEWYIKQQDLYLAEVKRSRLPYLIVETNQLPDKNIIKNILNWI